MYAQDKKEVYIQNIQLATQTALSQTGISADSLKAVCGCMNGADWSFEYTILCKSLYRATGCSDIYVINDCIGAMRGGCLTQRQSAVICAGSGLNIAVRRLDGKEIIYGYFIHNTEQGGSALGRLTLETVMDAYIGLADGTILTDLLKQHTGYSNTETMLADITRGMVGTASKDYAEVMLAAYRLKDPVAAAAVDGFSQKIANYVIMGMTNLGILNDPITIVYSGSVFKDNGTLVADCIHSQIQKTAPKALCVHARYEPVCGSLLTLLDKHWHGALPDSALERFDRDAECLGLTRCLEPK
jgi:N-acetylglucosamine kinase-like BadF-type ATPase